MLTMEEGQRRLLERILDGAEDPTYLTLSLLKEITDNFSDERKIGHGGFGAVYKVQNYRSENYFEGPQVLYNIISSTKKGVLGQQTVAVKRIYINENTADDRLFRGEFASLWNTSNRNVVRILGVCSEARDKPIKVDAIGEFIWASELERLLCFEYINNGSLDKHITDELRGFEWETRYEIITGICKGLRYLHEEKKIIHMDLKPANILLHHQDEKYMVPKITDFGLSRPNEKSHTVGKRYGTLGYMAPEYREHGETTRECDIYSLGAIIIELVTGSKDVPNKDNALRRWRHRWKKPPTQRQYQQVTRCIDIAGRCRKQDPDERPSIANIISFLDQSESTHGQISRCFDEDDLLGIKPLELQLLSELKKEIARPVELINGTRNCIAFNIKLTNSQYIAQPVKGVVKPGTMYVVTVTVQALDVHAHEHAGKFIVQSTIVSNDLRDEDITEGTFCSEAGKVVDEVDLMFVYEPTKPQDANTPAEEITKAEQRKLVESASGNGTNKLGSGENAEETSMQDTGSSTQGQCTEPTEQYNLHQLQSFSHHSPTNVRYLAKESDRAVDVARGAMGSLLDKLGKLVTGDYCLDPSIKKEIESFSVKLAKIHLGLPELQNVDQAKIFIDEVRELSYNIEDVVDGFLVCIKPDSSSSGFMENIHGRVKLFENGKAAHQQISDVIRDIKERVQAVVDRNEEYNFNVKDVVTNVTDKPVIYPRMAVCRNKEHLIGIEGPRDEVIGLFEEGGNVDKQDLRIVSIVGLGGLGKTTLATAVYEEFKGYAHKAFVPVGQNIDLVSVLKNIIRDCHGRDYNAAKLENLDVEQLRNELYDFLKNKRYFIVIDDLWYCDFWDIIKSALPSDKCGSRVITTTRIQEVVDRESWTVENKVYKIKELSVEDSTNLFFRRMSSLTPRKEEISKDILKKCGGMPLAINSIASHLARHPSESSWEHARNSLGAIKGNDIEKMKQILDLSYIHLPDHLKTCLLHVCMYPEDRDINKNDLLRQWVSESFVTTEGGQDAEDVAEEYFNALVDMFMIQPGQIDCCNHEVLSCRVHDIILELMRSKSRKEKFVHVIDGLKDVSGQIRRVSVESNDKKDSRILETINKGSLEHVRSVFLYRASFVPYFLKYNYVRVLHIDTGRFQGIIDLTGISRLFLLRYLKVETSYRNVIELPNQIGQLEQLETVYLKGGILEDYPPDIVDLPRLSHLIYRGQQRGIVLPEEIGLLKSLRTLVGVCVSGSMVEDIKGLGELTNLKELHIQEHKIGQGVATSIRMEALHSSICKLSASLKILYLRIYWDTTYELYSRYYWSSSIFHQVSNIRDLDLGFCSFRRCPPWIGQLKNLYKFRIVVRVVADAFSIVAGLPCLAYFEIYTESIAKKEERVVIKGSRGAFESLKELRFYCPKVSLTFEAGALPKLEKIVMLFRYHMARRFLPVGIQHLPSPTLKEISLGLDQHDFGKRFWDEYDNYADTSELHEKRFRIMLTRAFKPHHPCADIYLHYLEINTLEEVDDSEYHEGVDDEEDCCSVKYFSSEEDDDDAYEVSGSQTSAQFHANTRQVELIEAEEDSGRMGTNIDPNQSPNELDYEEVLWINEELVEAMGNLTIEVGVPYASSQLPYTSLPSYHELRQSISELSQGPSPSFLCLPSLPSYYLELIRPKLDQVQDPESSQLPCISPPPSLQLMQPRPEFNQGPSPSLLRLGLALCSSPDTADVLDQGPDKLNDEEADEGAYQENGPQTSAQIQANTRQLLDLIEWQADSGNNTYVPPTCHPILLGCHGRTEDVGSLQPPFTSLDLNQAAPGGLGGIAASAAAAAAQPQTEDVDDDPSDSAFLDYLDMDTDEDDPRDDNFWDNLVTDSDEGAEEDDDSCSVDFWESLLMDSNEEGEAAVGQA